MKVYIRRWTYEGQPCVDGRLIPFRDRDHPNTVYNDTQYDATYEEVDINLPDGVPIGQFSDLCIHIIVDGVTYPSNVWCEHPEWFRIEGVIVGNVGLVGTLREWWIWDGTTWVHHTPPNFSIV